MAETRLDNLIYALVSTSAADATWYSESPRTKTAPFDPRFEGASRTWSAGAFEGSGTNKSWTRSP